MEKVKSCISVLEEYKTEFENTRNSIDKFFKEDNPVKKWEFSNDLVFTRFDQFLKRVQLVEVCCMFKAVHLAFHVAKSNL